MARMIRCGRVLVSMLALVSVLTSAWATCAVGADASRMQQMACCKAGHDHCPMKDSSSDCCTQSGPQLESHATIVKALSISAPASVLVTWDLLAVTVTADVHHRIAYVDSSPPDLAASTPPAYIAFSALLI